jgi:hypothetical protein
MRAFLIARVTLPLLCCGPALAQVGMGAVTPPTGMTSPLGIGTRANRRVELGVRAKMRWQRIVVSKMIASIHGFSVSRYAMTFCRSSGLGTLMGIFVP